MTHPYNQDWFESLQQYNPFVRRALLAVFAILGVPESYLDIGCGTGITLQTAHHLLVHTVVGVEINKAHNQVEDMPILIHDLQKPLDLGRRYDLVTCWEVAEHLDEVHAEQLCTTIARHVGNWLVFTAAQVGQSGHYHVNEQPPAYWRKRLEDQGLSYIEDTTEAIAHCWRWAAGPCSAWLTPNVQVFQR